MTAKRKITSGDLLMKCASCNTWDIQEEFGLNDDLEVTTCPNCLNEAGVLDHEILVVP